MARAPKLTINLRFVGDAQSRKVSTVETRGNLGNRDAKGRFKKMEEFARVIVENIALSSSKRYAQKAKDSFEKSIRKDINSEIVRMGQMINKYTRQPENGSEFSRGTLRVTGGVADQSRNLYGNTVQKFDLNTAKVNWAARSPSYLKYKKKKGFTGDWFFMKGDLAKSTISSEDFGPVTVSFIASNDETPKKNLTASGSAGPLTATYTVGRLSVSVFGKITADMLPSLSSGKVSDVTPNSNIRTVASLISNKKLRGKLTQLSSEDTGEPTYRPLIEPFVSYYLTRAIPNAVFRRTEKLIDSSVRR